MLEIACPAENSCNGICGQPLQPPTAQPGVLCMKLYLNERPRAFVLVSYQYALIIRHPYPRYKHHHHHLHHHNQDSSAESTSKTSSKVIVEFVKRDSLNLSMYVDLTSSKNLGGFLGLLNVKDNLFLLFISSAVTVASPRLDEDVQRITGVEIFCLNSDEYDWQFQRGVSNLISTTDDDDFEQLGGDEKLLTEGPVPSVRKLLSLGSFFFSYQFDVSSTIQERGFRDMQLPRFTLMGDLPYQNQFMWNTFLVSELIEFRARLSVFEQACFDSSRFLTTIARGYAKTVNSTLGNGEDVLLTVISKQACAKNGPLLGDWGSDDNGNVSNFVESELVIYSSKFCLAYVMVRGNVPILWSLDTHISKRTLAAKKNKKVVFPRSFEASQAAFNKHLETLSNQYGDIQIVNALSQDPKTYKGKLNATFKEHIDYFTEHRNTSEGSVSNSNYKLGYTDMPVATSHMKKAYYTASNPHEYAQPIAKLVLNFGALFYDVDSRTYVGKQMGVFRVTSFDSLGKANFISKIIGQEVIELAMRDLGIEAGHDLLSKHARLWAETDEYLKKITVNFVSYTDKLHTSSANSKGIVSSHLKRKYLHTVLDHKPGEMAILKLLGALQDQVSVSFHNPLHDYVTKELNRRAKEFTSQRDVLVFASTFNVNADCKDQSKFKSWLFPPGSSSDYDLVFIGLQEIVVLSASQMVDTDTVQRQKWEMHLRVCLESNNKTQSRYILLWSGQLGGIALFLFVKERELKKIRDVEGAFRKTGFGGVSANKGAVAVRFDYSNTSICLVASHFAAGQSNTIERHQNYKTIGKGIKFSKNRRIKDHDAVVWLGDFNYRINLPLEKVQALVKAKDYGTLFEHDQLNLQMASGESFPYFDEMELKFMPTYKFDNGTSTYDTSEKQRVPAWTDRILSLSRKKIVKQHLYDCCDEIKFSDHRPVYAVITMSISVVNEAVKKTLTHELYENYRKNYGNINDMIVTNTNLAFLISEPDDKILLPPSSDSTKWWLSKGRPAKITIQALHGPKADQYVFNPNFPINPFEETNEKEIILRKDSAW